MVFLKNKKNKKRGFTLIELVVVISIIVIFAGFLIPKFAGYQTRAKDTKAINTAKQIQSAALSSYSEMDGKFVEASVEATVAELTGAEAVTALVEPVGTVNSYIHQRRRKLHSGNKGFIRHILSV